MLTDIDECQQSPCDSHADCVNSEGSFQCTCHHLYSGNGTHCVSEYNMLYIKVRGVRG